MSKVDLSSQTRLLKDADVVAVERRRAFNPVALGEGVFAERDPMISTSSCGTRSSPSATS